MTFLEALDHPQRRWPTPPPCRDATRICRLIETTVAAAFAVPVEELRAPSRRTATVAFARQCAMYLAHVVLSLNYSAVGPLFHRDRTTAAHACRVVEERRDDLAVDRVLQILEDDCSELARGFFASPPVRS